MLILKRNATRDYLDFVALAHHMGDRDAALALRSFDKLYRQDNGESPLQQLQVQLANALPYDLEETKLGEYKYLDPQWQDWRVVKAACAHLATVIFDRVCNMAAVRTDDRGASRRRVPPRNIRALTPTRSLPAACR